MKKKLSLCLLVTLFISVSIFADGVQPTGTGTEIDPYQVETLDNLLWISTNSDSWDAYFIQTADIDATDTQNWNSGEGFSPIGFDYDNRFSGCYDGQNHTIGELYLNRSSSSFQGLFGYTYEATIENLGVTNVDVCGFYYVGGLVGLNYSTVSNCYSTGSVSGNSRVGEFGW